MHDAHEHNSCINIPWSQTAVSCLLTIRMCLVVKCIVSHGHEKRKFAHKPSLDGQTA
jgi:hypothetical protein